VSVALLLATTSLIHIAPARAAEGVNLAWDHCYGQGTGVQNLAFACDTDAGSHVMTGSFVLAANLDQAVGLEFELELAAASPALPAWWDLWAAGSCRPTSLTANFVPDPADPACLDWSLGAASGGLARYCTFGGICRGGPPSSPNQAKIILVDAVAQANASDLTPAEYFAVHVLIDNAKTTGATGCGGCAVPVCIGLNSINVVGKGNVGTRLLTTASAPGSNFISWQGSAGPDARSVSGCPAATVTAARHSTWGTVKSLYR
jgi:hypothetical protein